MTDRQQGSGGTVPLVDGSMYGAAAFGVGYLLTLIPVVLAEGEQLTNDFVEGAGWVYYNAQFVDVEIRAPGGGDVAVETATVNFLTGDGPEGMAITATNVPALVYYAVPIVVLVGAGFVLASQLGASDPLEGAVAGASLVFGTVVFAFGGTFLFELGSVMGPDRLTGVLFVGILYPAVFGTIGGIVSTRL